MSGFAFPKDVRILRRSDFRKVYDEESRFSCPYFAAFCLKLPEPENGPKIGFTVTKALGKVRPSEPHEAPFARSCPPEPRRACRFVGWL